MTMTYTVLDKPPKVRKWRIIGKPNDLPSFYNPATDTANWWSDGKRRLLHLAERTQRAARDDKKGTYVRLKETRDHWYEVSK